MYKYFRIPIGVAVSQTDHLFHVGSDNNSPPNFVSA